MSSRSDQIGRAYARPEDIVTQPDRWVACSQYFVRRWMPDLGGNAASLVLFLRNYGYYNPVTGECRDEIRGLSESLIAQGIGCSAPTLRRLLADHPYIGYFVRVQPNFETTSNGHKAQTTNIYWVAMFDPIHPGDAPLLEEAKETFAEQNKIRPPFKMIGGGDQNDRGARLKMSTPPNHFDQAIGINYSESLPLDSLPIIINQDTQRNQTKSAKNDDDEILSFFDEKQGLVYKKLLSIHISQATSQRLAMNCDPEKVMQEIEIDSYRSLPAEGSRGRLISILEGQSTFPVPKAYREAQRQQRRHVQEQERRQVAEQSRVEEEALCQKLDTYYASLNDEDKASIDATALASLPPMMRQRPESQMTRSQIILRRREILQLRFSAGCSQEREPK